MNLHPTSKRSSLLRGLVLSMVSLSLAACGDDEGDRLEFSSEGSCSAGDSPIFQPDLFYGDLTDNGLMIRLVESQRTRAAMELELRLDRDPNAGVGVYNLSESTDEDCVLCLTHWDLCQAGGFNCQKPFGAIEGTIALQAVSTEFGGMLDVEVRNVQVAPFANDGSLNAEAPNAFCLEQADFVATVDYGLAPAEVGEVPVPFTWTSCATGSDYPFTMRGLGSKLIWAFAYTEDGIRDPEQTLKDTWLNFQNVDSTLADLVFLYGANEAGERPTLTECEELSAFTGIPLDQLAIDADGATPWPYVSGNVASPGEFGFGYQYLFDASSKAVVYAGDDMDTVNGLLNQYANN